MTTITAYVDQSAKELRSSISGTATPSIKHNLCTWLALKLAFMRGGEIEALADDTPVSMVIKPWGEPDAEPIALDVTADETGDDDARRYLLKALIDGDALRTMLSGKESAEFALQIAWGVVGEESYDETFPLKVTIVTSYFREGDAVPEPLTDAGWAKIKAFFPEGGAIVHNDGEKIIEITGGGGTWGSITGTLASQTDLANALTGKAATGHSHELTDITGLSGALNGKAAASHTHSISDVTGLASSLGGKEPGLGNPDVNGKVLSSTAAGVRSWVAQSPGAEILSLTGVLQGYTTPGSPATSPASITFEITDGVWVVNGVTYTVDANVPSDGTTWINSGSGLGNAANQLATLLGAPCSASGVSVTVATNATGSAASVQVNSTTNCGLDASDPSGQIDNVQLLIVPAGKAFRPIAAYVLAGADLYGVPKIISGAGVIAVSENAAAAKVMVPGAEWPNLVEAADTIAAVLLDGVPEGGAATIHLIGALVSV